MAKGILCEEFDETMAHIINGCPRVAQYQYKLQQHGERNKNYESETVQKLRIF